MNYNVLSVILGGGKGSRLYPLTERRSKPAVPIAGKYRLVDIPISNCLNSRINKIYVLTQFNSASLNKHVMNTYSFDPFSKGFVDILAAEQTSSNSNWYQGTADAVRQSLQHILSHEFEYIFILSGDQLYQMDLEDMLEKHQNQHADVTIATLAVNAKDATGFGIMKTNSDEEIISFIEKPSLDELGNWTSEVDKESHSEGKHYLASMGIYLFSRAKLEEVLLRDKNQTDFGKDIIPDLVAGKEKVLAYQFRGYWSDIGTIESFFQANLNLVQSIPDFNFYDNEHLVYTRPRMLPPSKVAGTMLNQALLGEGSMIFAQSIENSIIGIRTRIDSDTVIKNSYIMGNKDYESLEEIQENLHNGIPNIGIGKNCYLDSTIIDMNVRIGNDVQIVGDPELEEYETESYKIVDGIVVVKKGVIIPNSTQIGKIYAN